MLSKIWEKTKEIINNLKIKLIQYQIIILFRRENRKFIFKWLELKTGVLTQEEFNMWITGELIENGNM